jgi:TPR repeat protein
MSVVEDLKETINDMLRNWDELKNLHKEEISASEHVDRFLLLLLKTFSQAEDGTLSFNGKKTYRKDMFYGIGVMYDNGIGVEKNFDTAFRAYDIASRLGNESACNNLGYMYEFGYGVPRDTTRAIKLYKKAYKLGCLSASENLRRLQGDRFFFLNF